MTGMLSTIARAFRRAALPLASYYAVTLVIPIANGAAPSGAAFIEHALLVLIVPPVIIVVACAACAIARASAAATRATTSLHEVRKCCLIPWRFS